jgi:hypothetical protein
MLVDANGSDLPDAIPLVGSASREYIIATTYIKSVVIDVVADTNTSTVITPLPNAFDLTVLGEPSEPLLGTGGTGARGQYVDISAPYIKVVVTNAEAGAMSTYTFTARGSVR